MSHETLSYATPPAEHPRFFKWHAWSFAEAAAGGANLLFLGSNALYFVAFLALVLLPVSFVTATIGIVLSIRRSRRGVYDGNLAICVAAGILSLILNIILAVIVCFAISLSGLARV